MGVSLHASRKKVYTDAMQKRTLSGGRPETKFAAVCQDSRIAAAAQKNWEEEEEQQQQHDDNRNNNNNYYNKSKVIIVVNNK